MRTFKTMCVGYVPPSIEKSEPEPSENVAPIPLLESGNIKVHSEATQPADRVHHNPSSTTVQTTRIRSKPSRFAHAHNGQFPNLSECSREALFSGSGDPPAGALVMVGGLGPYMMNKQKSSQNTIAVQAHPETALASADVQLRQYSQSSSNSCWSCDTHPNSETGSAASNSARVHPGSNKLSKSPFLSFTEKTSVASFSNALENGRISSARRFRGYNPQKNHHVDPRCDAYAHNLVPGMARP